MFYRTAIKNATIFRPRNTNLQSMSHKYDTLEGVLDTIYTFTAHRHRGLHPDPSARLHKEKTHPASMARMGKIPVTGIEGNTSAARAPSTLSSVSAGFLHGSSDASTRHDSAIPGPEISPKRISAPLNTRGGAARAVVAQTVHHQTERQQPRVFYCKPVTEKENPDGCAALAITGMRRR